MRKIIIIFIFSISITACTSLPKNNLNKAAQLNAIIGYKYLQQKNNAKAKQKFLQAIKQNPNDPLILQTFAYFLETTGNLALAKCYYLLALKKAPHDGRVLNNYGAFLCRNGLYQQSIYYFKLAAQDINYLHADNARDNIKKCSVKITK